MVRVRYSVQCAGGCGLRLTVGQHAYRLHRTLWCADCRAAHMTACGAHDAKPIRPTHTLSQAALF